MLTHRGGDVTTKSMRGLYLPDAANIIVFAPHGYGHLALCQAMMHKIPYQLSAGTIPRSSPLQRDIRHRMPGECPVLLDELLIATHEVKEELLVASDMAIEFMLMKLESWMKPG